MVPISFPSVTQLLAALLVLIGFVVLPVLVVGVMWWIDRRVKRLQRRSERVDFDRGFEVLDKDVR